VVEIEALRSQPSAPELGGRDLEGEPHGSGGDLDLATAMATTLKDGTEGGRREAKLRGGGDEVTMGLTPL
jgi:hypothetical protein